MSRHSRWNLNLASPRNLRLGTLVLLLLTINQINDPLTEATIGEAFLYWGIRPLVLACGLWLADGLVSRAFDGRLEVPVWLKPVVVVTAIGILPLAIAEAILEQYLPFNPEFLDDQLWAFSPALALQAEEHYVRVYAEDSSELIQYRFGDAVGEMPTELGLQVHRSWWVAEAAMRAAKRGDRRWQLLLVNETAVPVSDSYVAAVRERGWLQRKPRQ